MPKSLINKVTDCHNIITSIESSNSIDELKEHFNEYLRLKKKKKKIDSKTKKRIPTTANDDFILSHIHSLQKDFSTYNNYINTKNRLNKIIKDNFNG